MRRSEILGKGMLLPPWFRHNCIWPTVGGVRARGVRSGAVVRLLQGPFAHGSTWGGEVGKTSSPLGDRSGVFQMPGAGRKPWCATRVANCWMQLPGQWMGEGHAIYWVVRESEGRRKLRTAARSPASTMSCGRRTGVGSGNVNRAAHFGGLMTLPVSSFRPQGAGSWRSALSMGINT